MYIPEPCIDWFYLPASVTFCFFPSTQRVHNSLWPWIFPYSHFCLDHFFCFLSSSVEFIREDDLWTRQDQLPCFQCWFSSLLITCVPLFLVSTYGIRCMVRCITLRFNNACARESQQLRETTRVNGDEYGYIVARLGYICLVSAAGLFAQVRHAVYTTPCWRETHVRVGDLPSYRHYTIIGSLADALP